MVSFAISRQKLNLLVKCQERTSVRVVMLIVGGGLLNPVSHLLLGWTVANADKSLSRKELQL
jgi:hypothetical protein